MEQALNIVKTLQSNGFEAYFVGGYVRDRLLGLTTYDVDITSSAHPDEIIRLFPNDKVDLVGKSFGVVLINGIEIATYRKDKYLGLSDKNVVIEPGTLYEDASRRDFTFNSLYFNPITGETLDFFDGKEDLNKKVVRFVGESSERIFEDPNRIIRACRFVSTLDGSFAKDTFEELQRRADYVGSMVAPERIRQEILKAMRTKKASRFFVALHDIGALKYIFPSLEACYGVDGGKHHGEGVFEHNMLAGDYISPRFPRLKLSCYLHDCGKYIMKRENPKTGEDWFEGHAEKGSELLQGELKDLTFSNDEISTITGLVKHHMRVNFGMGGKAVRRLLKDLQDEGGLSWRDLLKVRAADRFANLGKDNYGSLDFREMIGKFWRETKNPKHVSLSVKSLALNGNDVMEVLGLKPSPKVGEVLDNLLEIVLDDPTKNTTPILLQELVRMKV